MSQKRSDDNAEKNLQSSPNEDVTRFAPSSPGGNATPDSRPNSTDFDADMPAEPKQIAILGEYVVQEKIGAGGMGLVFRARHRTMQRDVALKILPKSLSSHPELVARFYSEVRTIAKLMHPNIVTAFDAGVQGDVHFLVMELVEGISLSARIGSHGVLSVSEAVDLLAQSGSALHYAHHQGVIHRDIKPSNMMWTHRGTLKLLDFGLARFTHEVDRRAGDRKLIGTVEYMSPEQIEHPDRIDHRTDLYSLGASLFFLLTGRSMFAGEAIEVALAHIQKKPPALYEVRSDLDLRLDAVFQRLVAKHPDDRHQDAQSMIDQLKELNLLDDSTLASLPASAKVSLSGINLAPLTDRPGGQLTSERGYAPIGIELGAINSRASYLNAQKQLCEVPLDGNDLSLRNMLWSNGTQIAIGQQAVQQRALHPNQIFFGIQRWFGLPVLERTFGERQVPPEVLIATLVRQIAQAAKRADQNISHAVVTVPGCYDQLHRICVANSCRMAGLEVLQLLDRPLAASIAYLETQQKLQKGQSQVSQNEEMILVLALTGGGCEASVVKIQGLVATTVTTVGDWKRNKLRWQHSVAEYLARQFQQQHGLNVKQDIAAASRLQRSAELAVDRLCVVPQVDLKFEAWQKEVRVAIDREGLLLIVGELANDVVTFATKAMQDANVEPSKIHRVLLVGDLLDIQTLRNRIRTVVPKSVPFQSMSKADLARGAALQAQYLMPPRDHSVPRAQATSIYDIGLVSIDATEAKSSPKVLIPHGSLIPISDSRTLKFASQTNAPKFLQFVEGTQLGPANWHRLGFISPAEQFPTRGAEEPLQLGLELDVSGIFSGKLTWLSGNEQAAISPLSGPIMDPVIIQQWRDWIETLMLCNTDR